MTDIASPRTLLAAAADALLDERRQLTTDELRALASLPHESVPALAALAHEVRLAWCGAEVEVEGILSAKTGGCPEDCHFCSQSATNTDAPMLATPFLDAEEILAAAKETAALGASEFCIVLAVRGPNPIVMDQLLKLTPMVMEATGLNVADQRRHPHREAGGAPRRRGRPPLQPQPRDRPVVLRRHRHHPHVGGALRDLPARPPPRHGAVLRRAARDGRERRPAPRAARAAA